VSFVREVIGSRSGIFLEYVLEFYDIWVVTIWYRTRIYGRYRDDFVIQRYLRRVATKCDLYV